VSYYFCLRDGFYDLLVILEGVTSKKATVKVQEIDEEIPGFVATGGAIDPIPEGQLASPEEESDEEVVEEEANPRKIFTYIFVPAVFIGIIYIFLKFRKKEEDIDISKVYSLLKKLNAKK